MIKITKAILATAFEPNCFELLDKKLGEGWIVNDEEIFIVAPVGVVTEIEGTKDNGLPIHDDHFVVHDSGTSFNNFMFCILFHGV